MSAKFCGEAAATTMGVASLYPMLRLCANTLWAVSPTEPQVMAARRTRAKRVQIGDRGIPIGL
jgi:hypothetical protein